MTPRTIARTARPERRRLVLGLAALSVSAVGLTSVVTGAFFTDQATATNNTFTTGTVDLTATPTTSVVSLPSMAPGDVVTAPLTVNNAGTLAYRYSVLSTTTSSTPDLAAQLDLTVKTGVTACTTAGFSATGVVAYGPADLGSLAGTKVIGDAATGQQTGDRTLAAGANEVLCLQVSLPSATGNTYQAKTTTATLTFDAEQTANNP
jgi:predicted ribosomally synthesized peptide with SipW-like signal peptide